MCTCVYVCVCARLPYTHLRRIYFLLLRDETEVVADAAVHILQNVLQDCVPWASVEDIVCHVRSLVSAGVIEEIDYLCITCVCARASVCMCPRVCMLGGCAPHFLCLCMFIHVYACLCMPIRAYACLCMRTHAYACLCMSMHVYACCFRMLLWGFESSRNNESKTLSL